MGTAEGTGATETTGEIEEAEEAEVPRGEAVTSVAAAGGADRRDATAAGTE